MIQYKKIIKTLWSITKSKYILLPFVVILCVIVVLCIYPKSEKKIKIAIATTVKNPHKLNDWIKYHVKIGFDNMYIVFDDETENSNIQNSHNIKIFKNDKKWKDELDKLKNVDYYKNNINEVMSRQILNFTNVRNYARKDKVDWLLNIDADELFYCEEYTLNSIFDNAYDIINFKNYEMIPTKDNYTNCFRMGVNFKTDNNTYNAYANGKSAVKVNSEAVMSGVHDFDKGLKKSAQIGKILHYPSCNFDEYINKYKILGKFSDKWWNSVDIPFDFHKESRDAITSCKEGSDCINNIRKYYNEKNVLNDTYNKEHIKTINFVKKQLE